MQIHVIGFTELNPICYWLRYYCFRWFFKLLNKGNDFYFFNVESISIKSI
ncbi:hypothetical protein Javan372_0025 [Streptococcus phage Javan372]|nr:hypothetical protein Javan372_0025 [Streptococcus phage Javan372]